ncbi:MAG: N-acetylmuramoyl-L-alanine amidase [Clostridia bacterium]
MLIVLRKRVVIMAGALMLSAAVAFASFNSRDVPIFSKSNGRIIVLDAGHGDPDGGAVGATGTVESTLNLAVAKKLQKQLESRGYTVIMTRETESGIHTEKSKTIREKKKEDMYNRLDIINSSGADLFISIHMNLFRTEKYHGAEVLYSDKFENSLLLAELIQAELVAIDPENQTRTVKKSDGDILLLRQSEIPAVLVECGFLSNIEEEKLLKNKKYQERLACAICDGIVEYYRSIQGRVNEI